MQIQWQLIRIFRAFKKAYSNKNIPPVGIEFVVTGLFLPMFCLLSYSSTSFAVGESLNFFQFMSLIDFLDLGDLTSISMA